MSIDRASQVLFAAVAIIITALVLSRFAVIIQPVLAIQYSWLFELGMVIGQVLFQWCFLARQPFRVKWSYALQVLGVSLMGAIMLIPLVTLHHFYAVPIWAAVIYFFGVVGIMFGVHRLRVKALTLPWYICWTWVLYRCLLLVFIVKWR